MREVAVVICNFNKANYVVECIKSVLNSTYLNADIYVVDNASEDDSIEKIEKLYKDEVNLIINKENKGGSGGFNTGILNIMDKNYKYVYLLDNDVIIDNNALNSLVNYLDNNLDVGAVGSKIFFMDSPNKIQEFGSFIDYENFNMKLGYRGEEDNSDIPNVIECDYVPACSMLIRIDVIKKIGIFNEDYFVYWDDIDFGYRLKCAGYKVAAISDSKVWHKGGGTVRKNTFGTYYFLRNRIEFFSKYIDNNIFDRFVKNIYDEIMKSIYSCYYSSKYGNSKTIALATYDALNKVSGRAQNDRIFEIDLNNDKFKNIFNKRNKLLLEIDSQDNFIENLIEKIEKVNDKIEIAINSGSVRNLKSDYDVLIKLCNHVFEVENFDSEYIYIDRFNNIVLNEEDKQSVRSYKNSIKINEDIIYPIFREKMLKLREN